MGLSVGNTLRKAERHAKRGEVALAAELYQAVLAEYPGNKRAAEGLQALGNRPPPQDQINALIEHYQQRRYVDLIAAGNALVGKHSGSAVLHTLLGAAHAGLGDAAAAVPHYQRALEIEPGSADVHNNLGAALLALGSPAEAMQSLLRAVELKPEFAMAHNNLGNALRQLQQLKPALEHYEAAIGLEADFADAWNGRGMVLRALGRSEDAIASIRQAISIAPKSARALNNLGNALNDIGNRAEAADCFRNALEVNPAFCGAHRHLSLVTDYSTEPANFEQMRSLYADDNLPDSDRAELAFALGKAHEDKREWDDAFAYFSAANESAKAGSTYDIDREREAFEQVRAWFARSPAGIDIASVAMPHTPIFIVGLPRSGTTLVEQILASHSQVFGAGELSLLERSIRAARPTDGPVEAERLLAVRRAYAAGVAELGSSEPHVTDKMPLNFRWLGFICEAMPEARIVHVQRDPRATCWSIFKHHFPLQGHEFANSLKDLGDYFGLYQQQMAYWNERYPGRIYDLGYEALTENQEIETRGLLNAAGLEFEKSCLAFHETERAVQTSSSTQVRQKMYTGSSDAWRRFEAQLQPLLERLPVDG